jgi:hypothetical protein
MKSAGRRYAFQTWLKFTKPISNTLLFLLAFQGLLGIVLANQEMKMVALVDMKFAELEAREQIVAEA